MKPAITAATCSGLQRLLVMQEVIVVPPVLPSRQNVGIAKPARKISRSDFVPVTKARPESVLPYPHGRGRQSVTDDSGAKRYRSLFLSDIHLGTKGCQSDLLLDFLRLNDAETIYLVGDIIDGWRLKSGWYWPQSHNDVVQKLLRKARKGSRVVYIPGNHDEFLRDFPGHHFGGIEVVEQAIHLAADGRR